MKEEAKCVYDEAGIDEKDVEDNDEDEDNKVNRIMQHSPGPQVAKPT